MKDNRLDSPHSRRAARAQAVRRESGPLPSPWPKVFTVWALQAESVDLVYADQPRPMSRVDRGWWSAATPRKAGIDYGFIIDGEGPFPDPRSAYQPYGVHGLSRVIDVSTFAWTDSNPKAGSIRPNRKPNGPAADQRHHRAATSAQKLLCKTATAGYPRRLP